MVVAHSASLETTVDRPEDAVNDRIDTSPDLNARARTHFKSMVESIGVKRFASAMDLSTRQVNRILSGVQPNPIERMVRCLQTATPEIGDRSLDFVCQEVGGFFVRQDPHLGSAAANAVRECAEAIACISDGEISEIDEKEIREAIGALVGLLRTVEEKKARNEPRRFDSAMSSPAPAIGSNNHVAGTLPASRGARISRSA